MAYEREGLDESAVGGGVNVGHGTAFDKRTLAGGGEEAYPFLGRHVLPLPGPHEGALRVPTGTEV